jgi:hypothetical protein
MYLPFITVWSQLYNRRIAFIIVYTNTAAISVIKSGSRVLISTPDSDSEAVLLKSKTNRYLYLESILEVGSSIA